jgi:hypothetical protein
MAAKWSIGLAALWLSVAAAAQTPAESSAGRGEQLFVGQEPLKGAIVGHDDALPAYASKCVNCHDPAANEQASYGSKLTPAALLEAAARRGGPPSRYEARSFCRLLRTGIDPAHVLILRAMPRYEIDDAQCLALWNYLILPRD